MPAMTIDAIGESGRGRAEDEDGRAHSAGRCLPPSLSFPVSLSLSLCACACLPVWRTGNHAKEWESCACAFSYAGNG